MHLYLNYAREHWTKPGENPPVGRALTTLVSAVAAIEEAVDIARHYAVLPALKASSLRALPMGR